MQSEAAPSGGFLEFLAWVEVNKQRLIIAAVIAVVGGFGVYVYQWNADQSEQAASKALLELRATGGAEAPKGTASDYLKVAANFPGTAAGQQAWLLGARALFTDGKYAEAQAQFEKFLTQRPNHPWAPQAAYGVAACLDARNELDPALAKYQDVASRYATEPVGHEAQLALARLYEAKNQPQLALKAYDDLLLKPTPGQSALDARQRRELLLQKNPQLASTNAPVAAATP